MTDRDPKDMTASEILRWLADDDDQSNCRMCHLFYSSGECGGNRCSDWKRDLADKIDAELAQARRSGLERAAKSWAKANGWPDFKDGENFGGWLDRCAIRIPCFEDGEPLTPGASFIQKYTGECTCKGFSVAVFSNESVGNAVWHPGERVKRPAPEVLGADGLPIVEGETVYPTYGFYAGTSGKVVSVEHQDNVRVELCCSTERFDGCYLTHTPSDTQERIDDDATMHPAEYCAVRGIDLGDDPDRETATEAMVRDLLRRQRELDKRTGGDA